MADCAEVPGMTECGENTGPSAALGISPFGRLRAGSAGSRQQNGSTCAFAGRTV